jgi:hypothetical protein
MTDTINFSKFCFIPVVYSASLLMVFRIILQFLTISFISFLQEEKGLFSAFPSITYNQNRLGGLYFYIKAQ